ncbi:MAG: endolytic transglycosylase MltG [Pseudomonadota bacterium]
MKRWPFFSAGLLFLIMVFLSMGFGLFFITPAKKGASKQVVIVKNGSTVEEVARELEKRKIISSRISFKLWARMKGVTKKIKAGEYLLSPNMPPIKILEILNKGAVITHAVTIPEGYTRKQIGQLLDKENLADKDEFLSLTEKPLFLKKYGISGQTLEGYLYPDTYRFARGVPVSSIIEAMVKRFLQVIGPLKGRADELKMELKEVIILASIIEKETGRSEERPLIASVFLNRLRRNMSLGSDPTVIYGMDGFNGNLTRKDLETPTPYNTYILQGLPAGPIGNPGLEAIKAVLYPAKTDYLYFVSKNDGSHHFSRTLSEHNRAVQVYQKGRGWEKAKNS